MTEPQQPVYRYRPTRWEKCHRCGTAFSPGDADEPGDLVIKFKDMNWCSPCWARQLPKASDDE